MTKKVQASLQFRKNVPGRRMVSIMYQAKYGSQLFTFQYQSWGSRKAKKAKSRNKDMQPLLLLAYHKGKRVWKAKNGKKYIYGFNLNYLPPNRRLKTINKLIEMFEESPGIEFSYRTIKNHLSLPASTENTIFRKYDVRGSKLRSLKEVNLDTYRSYLEEAINPDD